MDCLAGLIVLVAAGVIYWFADDYVQRPMSYWSREQLEAAFKRHPNELAKHVNRGSMSRKEWIAAMKKRDAEGVAELGRRGIKH
ncbi:hypothetical protein [Undibacterium oligocarboniphilum]|uniref:Uncharacterized protein n=1 Tax=Undibacterium oligocarboniphilum TaxID=666702 RepID=A0A850QQ59_9BURK|nr:hypothetical protein [Undibacterium oligocarboniphilum]MBC3871905.1 hypothetical protein [Undibacterium oligocarboniphilum]NVO79473.1 hypothetical protein [Undibacterium oligocarboniphilum]